MAISEWFGVYHDRVPDDCTVANRNLSWHVPVFLLTGAPAGFWEEPHASPFLQVTRLDRSGFRNVQDRSRLGKLQGRREREYAEIGASSPRPRQVSRCI